MPYFVSQKLLLNVKSCQEQHKQIQKLILKMPILMQYSIPSVCKDFKSDETSNKVRFPLAILERFMKASVSIFIWFGKTSLSSGLSYANSRNMSLNICPSSSSSTRRITFIRLQYQLLCNIFYESFRKKNAILITKVS